jgi:hypothetical protein
MYIYIYMYTYKCIGWTLLYWLVKHEKIDVNKVIDYQFSSDYPLENRWLFVHILEAWKSNYYQDQTNEHYNLQLLHCLRVMEFLIKNGHNAFKDSNKILATLSSSLPHWSTGYLHFIDMVNFFF